MKRYASANVFSQCFFEGKRPIPRSTLDKFTYVAGEESLYYEDNNEQIGYPYKVIIHPAYDPNGFVDDIAIVLLKNPFKYNKYVQPISIGNPPVEAIPGGTSHSTISN